MFLLLLYSCKKDEEISDNNDAIRENNYNGNRSSNEGIIVFGGILNDPYKFENMLEARNQLANERSGISTPTISATHKYMKYKPQNDEDFDLLKADTNLLLWDYPLHYEIAVAGTYYHDPSITDSLPTWQYFVVPNDYQLPTLSSKCELIYTLYFPDEDSNDTFYDDLEERAYHITGNMADGEDMRASSWTPSAVIKAYDDFVGWAAAIEWKLTNHHYNTELGKSYSHSDSYQLWHPYNLPNGKTHCYTPLFIDLMDDYNHSVDSLIYPVDVIHGYSISYIQDNIIHSSRGLSSFYTTLKNNKINGVTNENIDLLMALYWDQDYSR